MPEQIEPVVDVSSHDQPGQALERAVELGRPGQKVIYARDWRLFNRSLASAAWALYEGGLVDLVQRRVPSARYTKFEYIAIKRSSGAL